MNDPSLINRVEANTQQFRRAMTTAGFTIGGDNHPIAPVMLGDAKLASEFADKMLGAYPKINLMAVYNFFGHW